MHCNIQIFVLYDMNNVVIPRTVQLYGNHGGGQRQILHSRLSERRASPESASGLRERLCIWSGLQVRSSGHLDDSFRSSLNRVVTPVQKFEEIDSFCKSQSRLQQIPITHILVRKT